MYKDATSNGHHLTVGTKYAPLLTSGRFTALLLSLQP